MERQYFPGKRDDLTTWSTDRIFSRLKTAEVEKMIFLRNFIIGFTLVNYDRNIITDLDEVLCKLCGHIACRTYACENCAAFYCEDCAKILVEVFRHIGRSRSLDNESPYREVFYCMKCPALETRPRITNVAPRIRNLYKGIKVRCRNYDCEFEDEYMKVLSHMAKDCRVPMKAAKINMKTFHDIGRKHYPLEFPMEIDYPLANRTNTNYVAKLTAQLVTALDNDYDTLYGAQIPKGKQGAIRMNPIPQLQRHQHLVPKSIPNLKQAAAAERFRYKEKKDREFKIWEKAVIGEGNKQNEIEEPIDWSEFAHNKNLAPPNARVRTSPIDWEKQKERAFHKETAELKRKEEEAKKNPKLAPDPIKEKEKAIREAEAERKLKERDAQQQKINKSLVSKLFEHLSFDSVLKPAEKQQGEESSKRLPLKDSEPEPEKEVSPQIEPVPSTSKQADEQDKLASLVKSIAENQSKDKPQTLTTVIEAVNCTPPEPANEIEIETELDDDLPDEFIPLVIDTEEVSIIDQILSGGEAIDWDLEEPLPETKETDKSSQSDNQSSQPETQSSQQSVKENNQNKTINAVEETSKAIKRKISELDRGYLAQRSSNEPKQKRSKQEIIEKAQQEGVKERTIQWRLKRNEKREKENERRRVQRERKMQKIVNSISNVSGHITVGVHQKRINEAIAKLNKEGKRVCGMDIEKIPVKTMMYGIKQMPVWIGIVDAAGNPRLNKIIRYPKESVVDIGTAFHGLTWEHVQNAQSLNDVRQEVIEILHQYQIICVAGGKDDFMSLCFNEEDWEEIRPKLRDVNAYYNPRIDQKQLFALRYSTFLFFQKIIQDGAHSPIIDATYTVFLYLIDHEQFEDTFNEIKEDVLTKRPYANYIYPQNTQMAGLLRNVMNIIKNWPEDLRKKAVATWKWSPSYNRHSFLIGDKILRPPYSMDINQLFAKWKRW